jgi:YbbR domain-containing protein
MRFFTKNIGVKILALIFASSLWVYVTSGEAKTASFPGNVPIQIRNVPKDMALVDEIENLKLKIKAPYSSWQKLSVDNFEAYIDLAGLSVGVYEMDVKVQVSDPQVQIIEKNPSRLTIHLDPVVSKKVPVAVKIEGNAGEGFSPSEPEVDIKEVEIKGAETRIEEISEATAIVGLNGEMAKIEKTVRLISFDSKGKEIKNISFSPSIVKVSVLIEPAANVKTVGIKVNIIGQPQAGYWVSKVTTLPSTVTIKGDQEKMKKIEYLETANIDVTNLSSGISKIITLSLPEGIGLTEAQEGILVKIFISQDVITRTLPASFTFSGASSSSNIVNVTVSGPVSSVGSLSSKDIVINVGQAVGSVSITSEMISVPAGIQIIDFSPKVINVIVE